MNDPAIVFDGVSKRYGRGAHAFAALDDVSLAVERGAIHAIVGRSGAGKSTLVRTVNGLTPVTSGAVLVDGDDVTRLRGAALGAKRRSIGMIFQHFNLLDRRTVRGNVAFPLELQRVPAVDVARRVDRVLDLVGLADRAGHFPAQLSGGQKQRVGIARALITEPGILLSDEATSALDGETTEQILQLLDTLRAELDLTVLLITHELDVVKRIADSATLLERGAVTDSGRIRDLVLQASSPLGELLFPHRLDRDPSVGRGAAEFAVTFPGTLSEHPHLSDVAHELSAHVTVQSISSDRIGGAWFTRLHLSVVGRDGSGVAPAAVALLRGRGAHVDRY